MISSLITHIGMFLVWNITAFIFFADIRNIQKAFAALYPRMARSYIRKFYPGLRRKETCKFAYFEGWKDADSYIIIDARNARC